MLCFQEGENDEDMTCLDITIQASSTLRMAFHQEGEDDEDMTPMHMTMICLWHVKGVQKGCLSKEGRPRLI